jgi:hypothetical protein
MMLSCRKRGSQALVVAGTIVLVLVATSAAAQIPGPKGRVSFTATVGGCMPALDDVNRDIARGNDALRSYGWSAMDEINLGYTFTGDLRARVYGPLTLSLGGGKTSAQTDVDFDQVISVKPTMSFYHVRLFYDLPFKPMQKTYLRVGAGPVQSTGAEVAVRHERRATEGGTQWVESATLKAKGLGVHVLLEGEMMLNQRTTLVLDVGYRQLSLDREGDENNFLDWSRGGLDPSEALGDPDGDGIITLWTLTDAAAGGFLSESFLEVPLRGNPPGPIHIGPGGQRELVYVRDLGKIDFSGPQMSVGLRFYLF